MEEETSLETNYSDLITALSPPFLLFEKIESIGIQEPEPLCGHTVQYVG